MNDKKIIGNLKAVIEAYDNGQLPSYLGSFEKPLNEALRPVLVSRLGSMWYNVAHHYSLASMAIDEVVEAVERNYPVQLCNLIEEAKDFTGGDGYDGIKGYKTFKSAHPKVQIRMGGIDSKTIRSKYAHYTLLSILGVTNPRQWDGYENPFRLGWNEIDSSTHSLTVNGQKVDAKLHADGTTLEVRGLTETQIKRMVRADVAAMYRYGGSKGVITFNYAYYALYLDRVQVYAEDARAEFEALEEGKVR